jgi:isochorismate hydrolase
VQPWDGIISEEEQKAYRAAGFGRPSDVDRRAMPPVSHLIDLGADTLVVTACTTSGCVRGSVVDAFACNFRVLVPSDCVYDRGATSHAVNLFDMASKYADVITSVEILDKLRPLGIAAHA